MRFTAIAAACVALFPSASSAQVERTWRQLDTLPRLEPAHLRLVDVEGRPLAAGTSVSATVDWYVQPGSEAAALWHAPSGMVMPAQPLAVGEGGRALMPAPSWGAREGLAAFLRVEVQEVGALRRRAVAAWPIASSVETPFEMKLQPEEVLCSGRLVDERGRAITPMEVQLRVADPRPEEKRTMQLALGERIALEDGRYAVWGWPSPGEWILSAFYVYHGPAAKPKKLELGRKDLDLVLPATGHVQIQLRFPKPFPHGALEAVYRHVESGQVARWPIFDDTNNHRLLVGEHALRVEVGRVPLADLGAVKVEHAKQLDFKVELPAGLRVLRIQVSTEAGEPIPAVFARITGEGAGHVFGNEARLGGILVATAREEVELVVESDGFETLTLQGVKGDQTVKLKRVAK